jgi:hypothetical protein
MAITFSWTTVKLFSTKGERMTGLPESKDKRVFSNVLGAIENK